MWSKEVIKDATDQDMLPVVTKVDKKRAEEQKVLSLMFRLYCKHYHTKESRGGEALCADCKRDLDYACKRSQHCPRMKEKSFCAFCPRKCYSLAMSEKISKVMKFAGPRLLLRKPSAVISHVIEGIKEKRRRATRNNEQQNTLHE